MITRRCTERMFLLGAKPESAAEFTCCLAEAANRFGLVDHHRDWPGFITSAREMIARKVYHTSTSASAYLRWRKAKELELRIEYGGNPRTELSGAEVSRVMRPSEELRRVLQADFQALYHSSLARL
jgi:hypothetical protein